MKVHELHLGSLLTKIEIVLKVGVSKPFIPVIATYTLVGSEGALRHKEAWLSKTLEQVYDTIGSSLSFSLIACMSSCMNSEMIGRICSTESM